MSGFPRFTPTAKVLATSRWGWVETTGKSKLRWAYCIRSSFTHDGEITVVNPPATDWSRMLLFLNAEGRSKPLFRGDWLVKRSSLIKHRTYSFLSPQFFSTL